MFERPFIWVIALGISLVAGPAWPQEAGSARLAGKKGLQVQMVDDALELGIQQAALNFNLGDLISDGAGGEQVFWEREGARYSFRSEYLERIEEQIRKLSERGVVVSLILLNCVPNDPIRKRILVHPAYSDACPNRLAAFNTRSEEGRAWLSAAVEFLAERWGDPVHGRGHVSNWIVGNEVNSHWFWSNRGRVSMEEFAADYLVAVRLVQAAVKRHSPDGRVFVSLEHHWNIRYAGGDEFQTFPARAFLEYFSKLAREQGDFEWHIAFHPYPENLFEPRTWLDQSATNDWRSTPRITFRNLEVLLEFLQQPELRFGNNPRRVILSEQGFHTPDGVEGEQLQAAAFCYAWKKVMALDGIDGFILHRHVDHAHEGGLRLGLWTRREGSIAEPERKKLIYETFRSAGTAEEDSAFRFALPIIGMQDWKELSPGGSKPR
jgi:hypothetical protein